MFRNAFRLLYTKLGALDSFLLGPIHISEREINVNNYEMIDNKRIWEQ